MVEVVLGGEHAAGVDLALEHRVQQTLIKVIVAHAQTLYDAGKLCL